MSTFRRHADRTLGRGENEGDDLGDLRRRPPHTGCARTLSERAFAEEDRAERCTQRVDAFPRNAATLEADQVETTQTRMIAPRHTVGNHIVGHACYAADKRTSADPAI